MHLDNEDHGQQNRGALRALAPTKFMGSLEI